MRRPSAWSSGGELTGLARAREMITWKGGHRFDHFLITLGLPSRDARTAATSDLDFYEWAMRVLIPRPLPCEGGRDHFTDVLLRAKPQVRGGFG